MRDRGTKKSDVLSLLCVRVITRSGTVLNGTCTTKKNKRNVLMYLVVRQICIFRDIKIY